MPVRKIYILIVSLASILILAHVVIPHHHHAGTICLADKHAHNDERCDDTASHHGNNPDNHKSENCVLNQVLIPPDRPAGNCKLVETIHDFSSPGALFALPPALYASAIYLPANRYFPAPVANNCLSAVVAALFSLRAPPLN